MSGTICDLSGEDSPERFFYARNRGIPAALPRHGATLAAVAAFSQERARIMKNFAEKLRRFCRSEDGPTAVEYAVMLALIVIVCLTAIRSIGTNTSATFDNVAGQLGS